MHTCGLDLTGFDAYVETLAGLDFEGCAESGTQLDFADCAENHAGRGFAVMGGKSIPLEPMPRSIDPTCDKSTLAMSVPEKPIIRLLRYKGWLGKPIKSTPYEYNFKEKLAE